MTEALWARYRATSDADARRQLLDSYLGLVRHSAREVIRRGAGGIEFEELVSAGTVGLVQALEGFDPGRGLAFSTYAMPRIRGAMLDELRSRDWMPRAVRARSRQVARAVARLQQALGRAPDATEIAAELKVDVETYWRWTRDASGAELVPLEDGVEEEGDAGPIGTLVDHAGPDPEDLHAAREALDQMREAFTSLPQKDRLVLTLSYYEELTLRQIGEVLHITESRASQIRTRALRRLRERMPGATTEGRAA
jgi:RNA polymerase sigma factor for flagellar operon FliA